MSRGVNPGIDKRRLTHLRQLEAESIHIIREVAAEFENPVMLYSIGKDSSVMVRLALKAFHPGRVPFPLLHIDTTWKFRQMVEFRDSFTKENRLDLKVHTNADGVAQNMNPFDHGSNKYTTVMKTHALVQALTAGGYDAAFGGARRDEEASRAKERIYSFRDGKQQWDPKNQRPELWNLYNAKVNKGESIRVFPLSNWTELDVWQYIHLEEIPIVPLYFAGERPVVERDGQLIMVDDDRMRLREGEVPEQRMVRFRTLGCYPLTGAIPSTATTLPEIIREMLLVTNSERSGRLIDFDEEGSMELKKRRGLLLVAGTHAAMTLDEVTEYLKQHERKELLRFVAVGSVDDGKSTLIGRLLHDTHGIYEDQLAAVKRASKSRGSAGGELDLALLTDGLKAEREQGITIDVAYRYFSTEKRKFIIADTPGHIQYTRNMATGASTADVALILIDARQGVLQQSRRHAYIASLLGIPHLAVCVNKMDLVDFDRARYEEIVEDFNRMAKELRFREVRFFPISAVDGDNIVHASQRTAWHEGDTLLAYLEAVPIDADQNKDDFRFPVQYVLRPDLTYRGFCGQVASGVVSPGQDIVVLPSGKKSRIASIDTYEGGVDEAFAPMSVTLRLEDEIDISRGDMIVHPGNEPTSSQHIEAHVVWMSETPLDVKGSYLIKHTTRIVRANIDAVLGRVDLDALAEVPTETLELNDIGRLAVSLNQPIFFDPYIDNRDVGAFVLIDALSNNTVGAGMITRAGAQSSRGEANVERLSLVSAEERRAKAGHDAILIAFESEGADQREVAREIERRLYDANISVTLIDVETLSDPTRSPVLAADVIDACIHAGLVTILSTGLPRAAQRQAVTARLGERIVYVPEAASKGTNEAERVVLRAVGPAPQRRRLTSASPKFSTGYRQTPGCPHEVCTAG